MVAPCRACGRKLEPDARFCDQCGTPLDGAAPTDDTGPATGDRGHDDAVRKTVTVLFCDLSGSTSFEERVDAESARTVIGRYHEMIREVIEQHGGTVAKFQGDGAMALFGVPEVAADDAERAAAAGLEIQRRFGPVAQGILERYDAELGLRVGINTGEVVFSDTDADLVGDVLNTAARLEAAARPGTVLVGEDTWRLTRSTIAYEQVQGLDLKGKDQLVTAHRALGLLGGSDDLSTPFVGRADELARLQSLFGQVVATGSVRLATVVGAPGVGKTRLARELERVINDAAPDRAIVVDLRCERAGATTFAPITDLVRSLAEIDDSMDDGETLAGISRLVADLDDADRVALLLAGFVGAAPTRSTEELFFGVRRLIEALGRRAPTVLVIDDIQWAEPLFLDLLEHLAEWVREAPVLLLGLARPELRDIRPALTETGRRVAASVHLAGLDAASTAELAGRLVGGDPLPAELLARLPESTEGNPLFVRELMRMLIDDNVIVESARGWDLTIDADAVEVPPTIQSLLSSRIERMPSDERRLIELASVVGSEFPLGALAAISGQTDTSSLVATLERLRRKDLVESTGMYWGDEPLYRFHHVLIRDAAYRRLLKDARTELHLRVASWIESQGATVAGEHEVTVGHHLEQAHEYRMQLDRHDDETVEIGRRAAAALGAAATSALAQDDVAVAGSLARRALARLDPPHRAPLLVLGCEALLALGDVAAATPLVEELRGGHGDDSRLAAWTRTFDAQLIVLTDPDRLDRAEADAAHAAGELAALDDRAGEASARLVRAGALARLGRIGECEAELDRALGAARAADDGRRVAAVLGAAPVAALWGPSPVSRAGGRCLDVVRLLRITTGSPAVEATSTRCQAVLEALRGRFDTARSMLTQARVTVEELGHRRGLLETELYSGIVELLADDPAAAEPYLRSAYGGLGRLGIGADAGQAAAHLSRALLLRGRLDEADELAADSDALAGQNPQTAIAAKTALAEIRAARGELDEALRIAEEAVARAKGTDILIDHANANLALARVRDAAGDTAGARLAFAEAQRLYRNKGASLEAVLPHHDRLRMQRHGSVDTDRVDPAGHIDTPGAAVRVQRGSVDSPDARSRVDEMPNERSDTGLSNTASLCFDRTHSLVQSGGQVIGTLVGADATIENGDGTGQSEPVGNLVDPTVARRFGFGVEHRRLLAVRGERLALFELRDRDGDGFHRVALVELDPDGLIERVTLYEVASLADAVRQLGERWLVVDQPPHRALIELNIGLQYADATSDAEWYQAHLHDDCTFVDHRPLGFGDGDKSWMTDVAGSSDGMQGVPLNPEVTTWNDRAGLGRVETWIDGGTGELVWSAVPALAVMQVTDDRVSAIELFAADAADAANARFDELSTTLRSAHEPWNAADAGPRTTEDQRLGVDVETSTAATEHKPAHEAWNEADRLTRQALGELPHAADAWRTRLAPDVDHQDLRSEPGAATRGPEAVEAALMPVPAEHTVVDTVATRGDDLVLCRLLVTPTDDAGVGGERLLLCRWNANGQVDLLRVYDCDDLDAAIVELDRLYVEHDPGPAPVGVLRSWTEAYRFPAQRVTREFGEQMLAYLDPELRMIDHRSIGWPEQGFAEFSDRIKSLAALDVELSFVIARIHRVEGPLSLVEQITTATAPNGSIQTDRNLLLAETSPTSGLTVCIEQWPDDDLVAAMVHFDERTRELAVDGALDNTTTLLCNRLHAWARAGRWETCQSMIADDVEVIRTTGARVRGAAELADDRDARRIGFGCAHRRTLAVRGEQLALMEWTDDDLDGAPLRTFALVEANRRAEIERVTLFDHTIDSLIRAADRLDDLWFEVQQPPSGVGRVLHDLTHALRHRDRSELAPLLHADFEAGDHRPIGWGSQNRTGWLDLFDAALPSPVALVVARVLDESHDGLAGQMIQWALIDDELVEAMPTSFVAIVSDGQVVRVEGYELDDPVAAVDRLAERTHRSDGAGAVDTSWNEADRLTRAFLERLVARDVDGYRADLAVDIVLEDRRTLVHGIHRGRDAMMAFSAPGLFPPDSELVADVEAIAVRGDSLSLHRCAIHERGVHDGPTMEWLGVTRWRGDELERTVLHDPDALAEAVADLDDAHLDELGDTWERDAAFVLSFATRMLTDGDADGYLALHDPELVMRDHRQLGWPDLDFDGFRERIASIFAMPGDLVHVMERRLRIDPTVSSCSLQQLVFVSPEGVVESSRSAMVNILDPNTGRAVLYEQFDENDVQAAVDRFDELVAERGPVLWNRATVRSGLVNMSLRSGRPDAMTGLVADEAAFIDENGTEFQPFAVDSRRVLAVHGQHLGLVELLGNASEPESSRRFAVEETDPEHRLRRVTLFRADDLAGATDIFEQHRSDRQDGD